MSIQSARRDLALLLTGRLGTSSMEATIDGDSSSKSSMLAIILMNSDNATSTVSFLLRNTIWDLIFVEPMPDYDAQKASVISPCKG